MTDMTDEEAESDFWAKLVTFDWLKKNERAEIIFHAGFHAGLQHARSDAQDRMTAAILARAKELEIEPPIDIEISSCKK